VEERGRKRGRGEGENDLTEVTVPQTFHTVSISNVTRMQHHIHFSWKKQTNKTFILCLLNRDEKVKKENKDGEKAKRRKEKKREEKRYQCR